MMKRPVLVSCVCEDKQRDERSSKRFNMRRDVPAPQCSAAWPTHPEKRMLPGQHGACIRGDCQRDRLNVARVSPAQQVRSRVLRALIRAFLDLEQVGAAVLSAQASKTLDHGRDLHGARVGMSPRADRLPREAQGGWSLIYLNDIGVPARGC